MSGSQTELRYCSWVGFCLAVFLSWRQRGKCWAFLQYYREEDLSFPVSTASQGTPGKKRKCPPLPLQIASTTPNMSMLKTPQPGSRYPHKVKIHGGRESNTEQGQSRGVPRQTKPLGFRGLTHQTVWDSALPNVRLVAKSQAGIVTDTDCTSEPTRRLVTNTQMGQSWTISEQNLVSAINSTCKG